MMRPVRSGIVVGLLCLVAAVGLGWFAFSRLPPVAPQGPAFSVRIASDLSLLASEAELALPLEEALAATPGLQRLRTRVSGREVQLDLWLDGSANVDLAVQTAGTAVMEARNRMPADAEIPTLIRGQDLEVSRWLLTDDRRPLSEVREWAEANVRRVLEVQPGARSVTFCGVGRLHKVVRLDSSRLTAYGISAGDVLSAIDANASVATSLEELGAQRIGSKVQLRDLATISVEPETSDCRVAGATPGLLVTARHMPATVLKAEWDLPGLKTRALGPVTAARVRMNGSVDQAGRLAGSLAREETVMLLHMPSSPHGQVVAELLFSPHLTDPQRKALVHEVSRVPGARLESLDGMKHVTVVLSGPDRQTLQRVAESLKLGSSPEVMFVVPPPADIPELELRPDRERLARLNVRSAELAQVLRLGVAGVNRRSIHIELDGKRGDPQALGTLTVNGAPISSLATMELKQVPTELIRVNRQPAYEVKVFGVGHSQIPKPELPAGVSLELRDD